MPKVTFVNEHRTVEVNSGRKISDVAAELGINVCREAFRGSGIGDWTVYVKAADGALTPPTFLEKLFGIKGWRRLANRTKILGDVEIWTAGGLPDRLRAPRPVDAPPNPSKDSNAKRKPIDASGSAAFPLGHPSAVGKGQREAVPVGAGKGKKAGAKADAAKEEAAEEEASE
ncbi:MAG: hypothetical protein IPK82_43785 [Polyangiaceae bacterium]|nr:hypothetical protein [Polyangiaceae bacterium]